MSNDAGTQAKVMRLPSALAVGPVMALLLAVYAPTIIGLCHLWNTSPNFGHGPLVPVASLFLVWRGRRRFKDIPIAVGASPIWLLVTGLLMHVISLRGAILCSSALSFVLVLTWVLWFFLGKRFVQEISFPLFFLVFMIPIPFLNQLSFPLKALASRVSAPIVELLGIPVYREGTILFLPGFTLEVATACSGLKALVLVTAVGVLYAYLTLDTVKKRLTLVAACVPIALVANIGRIVIIALLSLRLSTERLFHLVHDYSGLPVYVIAGVLLAMTGREIEWLFRQRPTG